MKRFSVFFLKPFRSSHNFMCFEKHRVLQMPHTINHTAQKEHLYKSRFQPINILLTTLQVYTCIKKQTKKKLKTCCCRGTSFQVQPVLYEFCCCSNGIRKILGAFIQFFLVGKTNTSTAG